MMLRLLRGKRLENYPGVLQAASQRNLRALVHLRPQLKRPAGLLRSF
uniref:Uncharacterized protein n=1 Tax=Arundo donax TaxID=35708 RepID=A0A0A9G4I0_ARUDO